MGSAVWPWPCRPGTTGSPRVCCPRATPDCRSCSPPTIRRTTATTRPARIPPSACTPSSPRRTWASCRATRTQMCSARLPGARRRPGGAATGGSRPGCGSTRGSSPCGARTSRAPPSCSRPAGPAGGCAGRRDRTRQGGRRPAAPVPGLVGPGHVCGGHRLEHPGRPAARGPAPGRAAPVVGVAGRAAGLGAVHARAASALRGRGAGGVVRNSRPSTGSSAAGRAPPWTRRWPTYWTARPGWCRG